MKYKFKNNSAIALKDFSDVKKGDVSGYLESEDNTDLSGEIACAGGACEITF